MTGHRWKRAAALLLAGGMLLSQGGYVYAAEPESVEEMTTLYALDASGASVRVSEAVYAMINDGAVYLDEASGYLVRTADGVRTDPVTGEAFPEEEVTQPAPEEVGGTSADDGQEETADPETAGDCQESTEADDTDHGEASEQPGSGTEPDKETDGAEDGSQPQEEQIPEEVEPEAEPEEAQLEEVHSDPAGVQKDEEQTEAEESQAEEETDTSDRESLIREAQIVQAPVVVDDFRFWTVARKYGFAKEDLHIREAIPEDTSAPETISPEEGVRAIGYLKQDGLVYILKEEENGWLYVESGTVRGFIRKDEVRTGEEAQNLLETYQQEAKQKAEEMGQEYSGIEIAAPIAEALVSPADNEAYTWLRATVDQTVIPKEYALSTASVLNIREGKGEDTDIVGTMEEGALCYIIADQADDWVYVESGDVRGFVSSRYLETGGDVTARVENAGEESFPLASETVEPEENEALYYTLTSVKSGVPGGEVRQSLLMFASQFIGNPYVWGGTSLTDGADCSGFVQSIYREYGYELPRVAAEQAYAGTQIPVEDALPGDLVFYADGSGNIYHVVIYAGDSKTIEAQSSKTGIVQGTLDTADTVWAVRLLEDSVLAYTAGDISEVNASSDMYGENLGVFDLTYYCACEICCDVETGITATGTPVVEGRTIAVDPSVIPYGTQVIINGHVFTAEDCGGSVRGNHIDIYVNDHQTALELGRGQAEVYLVK